MSEVFRIHALYCGVNKDNVSNRESLTLTEAGVVEDYHNDNQILMLDIDTYNQMSQDNALCMKSFYANIIYDNSQNIRLSVGDTLRKNDIFLKIIKMGKRCHISDGCKYLRNHEDCPLRVNTIYLKCLSSGTVKLNDQWEVIKCIDMP